MLFEAELMDPLEAAGACVVATFRDLDEPNRWVWMRSFAGMEQRRRALTAFYTSDLWLARRGAANATMVSSDDVFLLRPTRGLRDWGEAGAPILATLRPLGDGAPEPEAQFVTEPASNTYPRLPVRTGEAVTLTLARDGDARPSPGSMKLRPPQTLRVEPTDRSRLR